MLLSHHIFCGFCVPRRQLEPQKTSTEDAVEPIVIVYLNRLSDLLFTMARAANYRAGATETPW